MPRDIETTKLGDAMLDWVRAMQDGATVSFDIETRPYEVEACQPEEEYEVPRSVQISDHDAAHWDVYLIPESVLATQRRFNVVTPKALDREALCEVAHQLCTYVRLVVKPEPEVSFNRAGFMQVLYRLQRIEAQRVAHAIIFGQHVERTLTAPYIMQPTAEAKARELLRSIDPILCAKMEQNSAFYFFTSSHSYIWYPSDRNIISLEDEGPRYVCIHSRDHTVEQNRYDWALTMRTYLLGDETTWRSKANFHTEFRLRGGRGAYPDIVREP